MSLSLPSVRPSAGVFLLEVLWCRWRERGRSPSPSVASKPNCTGSFWRRVEGEDHSMAAARLWAPPLPGPPPLSARTKKGGGGGKKDFNNFISDGMGRTEEIGK